MFVINILHACICASYYISSHVQAYAAARMAESVLLGLDGNEDIYECAYVESSVTKLPFFASKVGSIGHVKLL